MTFIEEKLCLGCAACRDVCPVGCIEFVKEKKVFRIANGCINCAECVETCPIGAIRGQGKRKLSKHYIVESECLGCGACQARCPANCIERIEEKNVYRIDTARCTGCYECSCPFGAIKRC